MIIMQLVIRHVNLITDLSALHTLTTQLGYPSEFDEFVCRIKCLHADHNYQTLVALYDQRIIGYLGYVHQYTWESAGAFYRIQALVIDEEMRRKRIGWALICHLESLAIQHQVKRLVLTSGNRQERQTAHQFYLNMGFEIYSTGFAKEISDI